MGLQDAIKALQLSAHRKSNIGLMACFTVFTSAKKEENCDSEASAQSTMQNDPDSEVASMETAPGA